MANHVARHQSTPAPRRATPDGMKARYRATQLTLTAYVAANVSRAGPRATASAARGSHRQGDRERRDPDHAAEEQGIAETDDTIRGVKARSRVLMPAKNSDAANSTTASE